MKVIQNKAVVPHHSVYINVTYYVQNVYRYGTTVLKMNSDNLSVCVSDVHLLEYLVSENWTRVLQTNSIYISVYVKIRKFTAEYLNFKCSWLPTNTTQDDIRPPVTLTAV